MELSARGRVLCVLVMLQTLLDHHSHCYNVKTDITLALHLGCRIYMWGGEAEGSRLEAWMKSHKSEVAIT